MSEFIPDLFDGLPEVSEGDPDVSILSGIRKVIQRLNQELSFVRELASVSKNVEAIEQKLTEVKATTYEVEKQQVDLLNRARQSELKHEENESVLKSFSDRVRNKLPVDSIDLFRRPHKVSDTCPLFEISGIEMG